jgi:hypothetical protein
VLHRVYKGVAWQCVDQIRYNIHTGILISFALSKKKSNGTLDFFNLPHAMCKLTNYIGVIWKSNNDRI